VAADFMKLGVDRMFVGEQSHGRLVRTFTDGLAKPSTVKYRILAKDQSSG
jgi:hypothetical protein